MNTLALALVILAIWAGAALIWIGWKDRRPPTRPRGRHAPRPSLTRTQWWTIAAGTAVGIVVWILTGWLVAVVIAPMAAWLLPLLFGDDGTAARIDRLDAMSEWARLLGSSVSVTGLEQAIVTTQGSIPEPIRAEVTALIARVRTNTISTDSAIRRFAEDLDDGSTGDLICATLLVAVEKRGSGLRRMLEALSDSVDEDVRNRRTIQIARRGFRTQTRLASGLITAFLVYMFLFTDYMQPYKQGGLQIVLAALLAGFAGVLYWMRRLTLEPPTPRFLGPKASHATPTEPIPRRKTLQEVPA